MIYLPYIYIHSHNNMPTKGSKNTSGSTTKDARCSWTDADDAIIVRVLKEQKEAGNQSGAGWKSQVWTGVEAALKSEGIAKGGAKTASKSQDCWTNVCLLTVLAAHSNIKSCKYSLRNSLSRSMHCAMPLDSYRTKKVEASDSVWETYLKVFHPNFIPLLSLK